MALSAPAASATSTPQPIVHAVSPVMTNSAPSCYVGQAGLVIGAGGALAAAFTGPAGATVAATGYAVSAAATLMGCAESAH